MNASTRVQTILFLLSEKHIRYNSAVDYVHSAIPMFRPNISSFNLCAAFCGYPGQSSEDSAVIL